MRNPGCTPARQYLALRSLASLILAGAQLAALAGAVFGNCPAIIRRVAQPELDSSVELEMSMTDRSLMKLLTTTDGKVRGLLGDLDLPPEYAAFARTRFKKFLDPQDVSWDDVPYPWKLRLLDYVSRNKKTAFFADRCVPGMRIRVRVRAKFNQPTTVLGKTYAKARMRSS